MSRLPCARSLELLYCCNPSFQIVLMVSPIPLLATFSGADIAAGYLGWHSAMKT